MGHAVELCCVRLLFSVCARNARREQKAARLHRWQGYVAKVLAFLVVWHLLAQLAFSNSVADLGHQAVQVALLPTTVATAALLTKYAYERYQQIVLSGTGLLLIGFVGAVGLRRWPGAHELLPEVLYGFPLGQSSAVYLYHLKVAVVADVFLFAWALVLKHKGMPHQVLPKNAQHAVEMTTNDVQLTEADPFLSHLKEALTKIYMDENLRVGTLARTMLTNEGALNKTIKNKTDLTTGQYILAFRLERARELLHRPPTQHQDNRPRSGAEKRGTFLKGIPQAVRA
jgi:Transcriptional regulator containing an amidase domain and an AraC-type DNA-binding HTH domain